MKKMVHQRRSKSKKAVFILLVLATMVFTSVPPPAAFAAETDFAKMPDEELLDYESRKSFDFFWEMVNTNPDSPGYGLIRDRAPNDDKMSSVASVGFGLSAIVIGVERGWITEEEGKERVKGTLNTLLHKAEQIEGFFYHFLDMNTAKRYGNVEVSIIDTAIAVSGALSAGEYFGGEIKVMAEQLYDKVNWGWYRDSDTNQFYMGYSPEDAGDGFSGHWDFYAEQFMLYFLGVAAPNPEHRVNSDMFYDFVRQYGSYGGYPEFIHSWFGSIFTHQFSYAWFDVRNKADREGVDWWHNSVIATKTARQFSILNSDQYKTFGPNAWGMTAADGPDGYVGRYGSAPSGYDNDQHRIDGTIPTAGALGSIVFAPDDVMDALRHYYSFPELIGPYGLKDSFNLDIREEGWFAEDVIGIDKGITLLMIENYRTGLVWDLMNKNKYVQAGLKRVGLTENGTTVIDDFEGNRIHSNWFDGGDGAYTLSPVFDTTHTGLGALKVGYNKTTEWAYFAADFKQENHFSQADSWSAFVSGTTELLIKFETAAGMIEKSFHTSGDEWSKLEWVFSPEEKGKLVDTRRMLVFAAPGERDVTGTFYVDDVQFNGEDTQVSFQ